MAFTPLTSDQYQKAIDSGFTPDQIIANEQKRKQETQAPTSIGGKILGGLKSAAGFLFGGPTGPLTQAEAGIGGLKGAASTVKSTLSLGEKLGGGPIIKGLDKLTGQQTQLPSEQMAKLPLTPTTPIQKVGFGLEQIAEFLLPVKAEETALKALDTVAPKVAEAARSGSILAKMAQFGAKSLGTALEFAGKTALQTGGPGVGTAGVIGAVTPALTGGAGALMKGLTEILPERLYSTIFKTASDDLRAFYNSMARGEELNPTLAKEVLDRGVFGSSKSMAVYSISKLDSLEKQVQSLIKSPEMAGKTVTITNPDAYKNLLDSISTTFEKGFYNEWATEAARLSKVVEDSAGYLNVEDTLGLRRFLDRMRSTSSFRMDAKLGPRSAEFKDAANSLRKEISKFPPLKALMNEERVFIQSIDSIVDDAAKRQNRDVINLTDAILGGGGLATGWGLGPEVIVRGFRLPSLRTGLAQGMYQAGKAATAAAPVTKQIPRVITPLVR